MPLAAACLLAIPCRSADFHVGSVDGLLDLTISYGLGVRVDDADKKLVAIANGGKRSSANQDDGTLNYNEGVFSNALRFNGDLTLAWRQFGAYIRGFAFYGYRFSGSLTYQGILGGITLVPRFLFTHDLHGTTPAPVGTFVEE
ncbi:MAG: DUF1302 family protein [Pseudomonadota bacterium]|nr:DUF1302 family protein [Pseudomonadota bacterium]